ncbi:MAG: amidophosphoribosyltransferase [Candidatus Altiarchaeota archaeon]
MKEKCAVFGIISEEEVFSKIYFGLYSMQHRGQESAGIATFSDGKIHLHKEMGLVVDVFKNIYMQGNVGIGHVRYSTTGSSEIKNSQPLMITYSKGTFAIAHNGNLTNYQDIKEILERKGAVFSTTSDTEVIAQLIAHEHIKTENFMEGLKNAMRLLDGAYSLTMLNDKGELIAVRDPWGFRPLCLGKLPSGYVVASETCAFDILSAIHLRDVKPGEIIIFNGNNMISEIGRIEKQKHCMFEYVYFSRSDSFINGIPVYQTRKNLGKNLYEEKPTKADIVTAVPDSGITAAIGYHHASGIKYSESLIKNRYTGRTFIMPEQKIRESSVKVKLSPVVSEIKGKEIILIDDSIVRGTTIKNLVNLLKKAGAKKVHVRITCPPLKYPCFYGVDMKTRKEFIASEKTVEEICKEIGADSLYYNSLDGLVKSIGIEKENLCLACLTGEYPVREKQIKLKVG